MSVDEIESELCSNTGADAFGEVLMSTVSISLNPLMCTAIEIGGAPAGADRLLDFVMAPDVERTCEAFVCRYRELGAVENSIPVAPYEPVILQKVVGPLREAKVSYALGNYLSCIALCGMVGEMVALLLSEITSGDAQQTDTGSFERLRQVDRIRELRKLNLIDDAVKQHFDSLRHIRSKYLHFLSQSHDRVAPDAKLAYEAALKTVAFVLQVDFREGAVVLRKDLVAYLVRKGVLAGR